MSSNHTEHYNLSQWERSDKVVMDDFNEDNAKIDTALAELESRKAEVSVLTALQAAVAKKAEQSALNALQSTVTGKGNCRIELGSYVGTGTPPVSIKTSFPPKLLIVVGGRVGVWVRGYDSIYFISDNIRFGNVTWRDDGLSWTPGTVANESQWNNQSGITYYYAVLG